MTKPWNMARARSRQRPHKRSTFAPVGMKLHNDAVCACGFIFGHAEGCLMRRRAALPPRFTLQEIRESVVRHCEKVLREPPPGWRVDGEEAQWHFGLATSNRTAFGCVPGRCSCYDAGTLDTRHEGRRYSPTREAAVAACWERHEAEQAVLGQAELARNTCPTCGFQRPSVGEACPCGSFKGP